MSILHTEIKENGVNRKEALNICGIHVIKKYDIWITRKREEKETKIAENQR